jgi:hypothetical protein
MPASASRTPPRPITFLVLTFAALAAILWLIALITTPPILFPAGPNFEDVLVYKGRFTLYHTAKFFTSRAYSAFAYPAGAAPIYAALYSTADATQTYLLTAAAATVAALAATFAFLRRHAAAGLFLPLLLMSFPLVFLIQRANLELVLWVIIALGILAYRRNLAILAAVLFGLAAAIKLYPIFLLGLFLKPARNRTGQDLPAFFLGGLTAILALAAAIAFTGPTFNVAAQGFFIGVDRFQGHYVDTVSKVEIAFDHCLFSPFKYLATTQHLSPAPWRTTYYLCAAAFALLLFFRVHTLPFLNRLVFLVAAMVSLPPVSFTYTLVHLYLPMLLLLAALIAPRNRPSVPATLALALLLFLMLPFAAISAVVALPTGPIQACALLALLILCATQPWQDALTPATL